MTSSSNYFRFTISKSEMKNKEKTQEQSSRESVSMPRKNCVDTEKRQLKSEALFRTLFENANDGIMVAVGETGIAVYANKKATEITGYSSSELQKLTIKDLAHPHDYEKINKRYKAIIAGKFFSARYEPRLIRKDGRPVNLEVTSSKTVWHGETADLVIFRDIDHRKETEKKHKKIKDGLEDLVQKRTVELSQAVERLEEEISNHKETAMRLREAENKFRTLVEQPPNAIIYIASLDETSSTLYISPQIEPILGYTQEEFKADPDLWAKSIHPDDYDRVIAEVATCHETGEQFVSEYRMIRKDGSLIWFNDHARIVQLGDGDRSYLLGINTDITQQKQMENALRKREEELTQKSEHLEEVNVALRILLRQIEKEKEEIKENILVNLKQLVFPNIEKLKGSRLDNSQAAIVSILETDLKDITSPLVTRLSSVYLKFTTTEIKVANLIKDGRNTKEIAELLNLSPNTVMFHRYNLRRKLGLKGHNINLRSYLRSFKD